MPIGLPVIGKEDRSNFTVSLLLKTGVSTEDSAPTLAIEVLTPKVRSRQISYA